MVLSERPSGMKSPSPNDENSLANPDLADSSRWPRILVETLPQPGSLLTLTADQQHYLHRVRRCQPGDPLILLDGRGSLIGGRWQGDGQVLLEGILHACDSELKLKICLGLAVIKGHGWDELIRQLTELGVYQITPLLTQRTQLEPGSHKLERWRRIAGEATEQCERTQVLQIQDPCRVSEWWASPSPSALKTIAVARGQDPHLLSVLDDWDPFREDTGDPPHPPEIDVAIGPEGGWDPTEVITAMEQGWQRVSLGARILRAVTAPVVVASWLAGYAEAIGTRPFSLD